MTNGFDLFQKRTRKEKVTYTQTVNGHPIVIMPKHMCPSTPTVDLALRQWKPRSARRLSMHCRQIKLDVRKQVVFYVRSDGGSHIQTKDKESEENTEEDRRAKRQKSQQIETIADTENVAETMITRKGRPKGSKNKPPLNTFNRQCEKRSLTYTFTSPTVCKYCNRTFDGDPLAHCTKYHRTVCSICGGTFKPPLTGHIKSHGIREVSLTVTCYECYDCKEKFGNAATMAKHVLNEHIIGDRSTVVCHVCDVTYDEGGETKNMSTPLNFPCKSCGAEQIGNRKVDELKCAVCGVWSDNREAAVDHLVNAHCPRKSFSHPAAYRCRVCHVGFKSQINVLRHACNQIKSPHCGQCDKTFPSKMRYAFHLQFHKHPDYPTMHLHCDLCLAEFEDEYQLYDHIRFRHELHDKAVCEVCGRMFKSSMGLNIHRRYHNGSRNFTCKSCDKSFLNKSTLREHEISHMEVKPFQCHICGQYLSRASRLRAHVKTHKAAESTEQLCYFCSLCGFVSPGSGQLAEHEDKEHATDGNGRSSNSVMLLTSVVKCEFCDSSYLNGKCLNDHRNAAHDNNRENTGNSEAFVCVVCSSTFSTYSRLTTHKLTHGINMASSLAESGTSTTTERGKFTIPRFFSCQYCSKMCLHYTYFCLHRRLKHPPTAQAYKCELCPDEFKTSWKLAYHRKITHGQQQFTSLVEGQQKKQHQQKPEQQPEVYECTVCPRKFLKIGALNLHKTRSHIEVLDGGSVTKYLCQDCGKFFNSEWTLNNHRAKTHVAIASISESPSSATTPVQRKVQRRHTATTAVVEKSCVYCGEKFRDNGRFVEHFNRHIQNRPVLPSGTTCELCDANFKNSMQLKNHLENHSASRDALLCHACYVPFLSTAAFIMHTTTSKCPDNIAVVSTYRPDVRFVDVPPPIDRQRSPAPGPLVVDCSEIFKGEQKQKVGETSSSSSPSSLHATTKQSQNLVEKPSESTELNQYSELDPAQLDNALDFEPTSYDFDDIFNSIPG